MTACVGVSLWQLLTDDGPPFIKESPKSITVRPDQNFTLLCAFTSNQRYSVVWLLNKVAYRANDLPERHSSQTNESQSTLVVSRAVGNGTMYQCALVDYGSGHQVRSEVAFVTVVGECEGVMGVRVRGHEGVSEAVIVCEGE